MIKIFESWTFNRTLPEPFAGVAASRGKKDTTEPVFLSIHNHMTRAKRATLHAPTLNALLAAAVIKEGEKGAFGVQEESGIIQRYCMEYAQSAGSEVKIGVYEPQTGKWSGIVKNGNALTPYPQIGEWGSSGREIIMMFILASMTGGPLYDQELSDTFQKLNEEIKDGFPDPERATDLAYLCCDNLYRRISNCAALGAAGIPLDGNSIASGNVPLILTSQLDTGTYNPTRTVYGKFQVLECKKQGLGKTIAELKEQYNRKFELTEPEKLLVPKLPENYHVSAEAQEILEAVIHSPMRVFLSAGEAGTGKTTNAKIIAQLLGLPYYAFTCSEGTDEVDLVSSMVPNTGEKEAKVQMPMPTYRDIIMDPASALAQVCGSYDNEINEEEAFRKILTMFYQNGFEQGKDDKKFVLVESCIVTGCRRPSLVEIQEPSVITKPGTMVKLNGLLDEGAVITLTSGEIVKRHPETVILITTNMGYKGCRGFNESVLSRMRMVHYLDPLDAEGMVARAKTRVEFKDEAMLKKMADTVCEIQKYCKTEMVSGGVCGYREFEDWVWAYTVQKDVLKAAKRTIVAKAAPEEEEREEIYKNLVLPVFGKAKAA
ncbi:MAG: hypothetical protein Q4C91_00045 [Eubacteriales bacterium]|nr:hypothetical protein [Eubacteriales bacterium]